MFDIGALELFVIVVVAVVVIGPNDMPRAMRTAGRWIGKVRRVSTHFRTGIDAMVREAELEDMEKEWKARNEEIMRKSAASSAEAAGEPIMTGPPPIGSGQDAAAADAAAPDAHTGSTPTPADPKPADPKAGETGAAGETRTAGDPGEKA